MGINPVDIILGGIRGAAAEAIPSVLQPAVDKALKAAHESSPRDPAPVAPPIDVEALARAIEAKLRQNPAVENAREEAAPIPFWQSPVMLGSLLGLFGTALSAFMPALVGLDWQAVGQIVAQILGGVGALVALISRIRSQAQPVTAK